MVFESLVADLLNKYLGDYVENLDKSQLNIGIWGGDVVLKNLDLKASALDDLDLPVKVISGHLGTLVLKIPWKKIYTAPLEVVIEDLFAVVAPNAGEKYDVAKEAQAAYDKKTKQLNRVESLKLAEEATAKESSKKGDSFGEKLATQIVKNLQVKIKNIHIRYEDSYTTPKQPFAVGITLDNLSFQGEPQPGESTETVDEDGNPKVVKETVQKLFKSAKLSNLALYWNSNSSSYLKGAKESVYITMKDKIATTDRRVKEHQFLIRPINCTINMELDTHPERSGFTTPQLALFLVLQEIGLQISRTQYYDIMEMLESFERMVLADKYRKYRQYLPAKPSNKQMWMYAYTCVLEEDVKRKREMWSWDHIRRHRELMRIYKTAYKKKLESTKKQSEVHKVIEQCEKELDVFSIVLMRNQSEMEVARAQKEKSKGGVFSFFRSKKSKSEEKGIKDKIDDEMSKEEYDKLYKAIGYEESSDSATALPPDYVAHKLHFELHSLSLTLQDTIEKKHCKLLSVEICNVAADVLQKPTPGYVSVKAKMGSFAIHGLAHDSIKPMIVRSLAQKGADLVDLEFELKPLDQTCDQRLHLTARATEIVYDAMTINHVVTFFKPPEHVKLKQLSKAAASRYTQLKEQSTAGLKDIVQHHKYTEVKVEVEASYVLIPETGTYRAGETNLILIDLGNVSVMSEKDPQAPKKYRAKAALMKARRALEPDEDQEQQDKMLETVIEKAYDSFTLQLDNFQVLYAHQGSDWNQLRKNKSSPLHIIQPMGYKILLQKCMIEDPRLPDIKIAGKLPQVQLTLSDERLLDIIRLVLSISLPDAALPHDSDDEDSDYHSLDGFEDSKGVILEEMELLLEEEDEESSKTKVIENATNMTEVDISFEIEEIEVKISQTVMGKEVPFLKLKLESIGTRVMIRSFDIVVESYLVGIYLQHLLFKVPDTMLEWISNQSPRKHKRAIQDGPVVNLINTPVDDSQGDRLLTVSFTMAYNDNPEFTTTYKNTENSLTVVFSHLEVLLHEQALLTVIAFAQDLAAKVEALTPAPSQPVVETTRRRHSSNVSEVVDLLSKRATKTAFSMLEPKVIQAEIIRFNVSAHMDTFEVSVCTDKSLISHMNVEGFDAGVLVQDSQTEIRAKLTNIVVVDPEPNTRYAQVVSIAGSEVFNMTITLYNKATKGLRRYADMSRVDTRIALDVSSIRFVFLYRYISQLISFVDNFDIAKQQALAVGAKAGEIAIDAAQSMHSNATRLALAITVNAPIITIPSHSTSVTALILHLGTVSVHNAFAVSKDQAKNKGLPAVLDCMAVALTDLQIQRALIDKEDTTKTLAVCRILDPVDMKVDITRNLASSWYHKVPLVDVNGSLPNVKVTCSQGDFTVLMKIVHENLAEGADPADVQPKSSTSSHPSNRSIHATPSTTPMIPLVSAAEIYTEVKVAFTMDVLEAVLYDGETNLDETVEDSRGVKVAQRQPSQSLARFSIAKLSGGFERQSNSCMKAQVSIFDCNLDDIRLSSAGGITKMIERINTGGNSSDPMIQLAFIQAEDLSKKVDVHLRKLFVIIAVPYLMAIGDFFTNGLPKVDNKQKAAVQESKDVVLEDVTKDTLSSAETVITVHVEHPEVILVEDTSVKDTNALILDTGVKFQMRVSSQAIKLNAGLELQIISAMYNVQGKKYHKIAQIMKPCSINVYGSAPDNKGMHIDVSLTELDLCVSPATITTISKIASNLQVSKKEDLETSTHYIIKNLWVVKKVSEMSMWYLHAAPTDDYPMLTGVETDSHRGEQILINAPSVIFKLEGGTGNKTVPLLVAEMDAKADVREWSSKLSMEINASLAVSYFNEKCSVWEPFLEPVDLGHKSVPWVLSVEVKQNDEYYTEVEEDESDCDIIGQQPPKMSVTVTSEDALQMVLSKAGLDMLKALANAFGDAYRLVQPSHKAGDIQAPYTIRNDTGTLLAVTLDHQLEKVAECDIEIHQNVVTLEANSSVQLQQRKGMKSSPSLLKRAQEGKELDLSINMIEYEAVRDVVIQKAIKRCFHVFRQQDPHALVIETTADLGRRLITLRSDTEIVNSLDQVVSVLYMDSRDQLSTLKVMNPGDKYNLPLPVVYGKTQALFFKPHVDGIEMSGESVKWKSLSKNSGSQLISCVLANKDYTYNIMVQAEIESVYSESTEEMKSKCIVITLKAPIVFFNQLPYTIDIKIDRQQQKVSLEPGKMTPMYTCAATHQTGQVILRDYLGSDWRYSGIIDDPTNSFSKWNFARDGSSTQFCRLAMCCKSDGEARSITLYSPYWFMNRTGLDMFYKDSSAKDEEIIPHQSSYAQPFLFCFKKLASSSEKGLLRQTWGAFGYPTRVALSDEYQACMRISDSQWSDKFSLDTVGSSGTTDCKSNDFTYQVGVKITLSSNGLTKIVECSPYYVLTNYSNSPVTFIEQGDGGSSLEVLPNQCLPFWPRSTKTKLMKLGVTDSTGKHTLSSEFLFDQIHSTLLKLGNQQDEAHQKCAIYVEVTKSDLAIVVTVDDYKEGMEAARIVNCMSETLLTFHQKKSTDVMCLEPGESCLYTWDNPLDKRMLVWSSGMEADKHDELVKDAIGEFFADKDSNHKLFWVSFLDGMQRVLLFTEDILQATRAQEAGDFERIELELVLSLEGFGVSLVDNESRQEIAYMGVTSSGVVWEEKRKRRWKAFSNRVCESLEEAYVKYNMLEAAGKTANPLFATEKLQVDLQNMRQLAPHKRSIRRTFQPGVWMQYKTSLHQTQLHAKINRVQFDDQLPGAVYAVVFSPSPLPKSVAAESVPKPFIEASLVMRKHEHSDVQQIKYLKVLIQEMSVKADQGFINAIIPFFGESQRSAGQMSKDFEKDIEYLSMSLLELSAGTANKGHKNFYDQLHISPLKIHLSFSVQGKSDGKVVIKSEVVQLFLQSVGVVLTDVQDILFRIAYFERNYVFFEQKALVSQIQKHYTQQFIKQAYVLVLGLDVLGNPFGLIEGLADGAKGLFYEPIQGAIQGPEEFAEGLALGLRSLLSGTVGGVSGAVSRITGTLGKGLAAITLDEQYQQRRREKMTKEPANLQEGLARGVKGLGMGFYDGVTGIVKKPVQGAKQEGVEGFFKGLGKGLIGVVARPTGGIVDFASSSFEGIRKATTLSQEVTRLRPPRIIRKDGVITPYNYRQASGNAMLREVARGCYVVTDELLCHCRVTDDGSNFILATDKRMLFLKRGELLMNWDVEWSYEWTSLLEPPSLIEGNKIKFLAKNEEKKKFSLLRGKGGIGKIVTIPNNREAEWMVRKMTEAYQKARYTNS